MGLITENDLLKEQLVERLRSNVGEIEQEVLDSIFTILDKIPTSSGIFTGIVTAEQLLEISQVINQALATNGYRQKVELFISDFGKVTLNTSDILKSVGGYDIRTLPLSAIEKKWANNTIETLLGSGINENFKRPIQKIIDDTISDGGSISQAKETLIDFVKGNKDKSGKLKSYLTQTARDSVSQLQGQQFKAVSDNVETKIIRYVGGLLTDSRGQCTRWVKELHGRIKWTDLDEEIKLAYKNQERKLEEPKGHRWGGMMPNTTPSNFLIKRGGYNCTHTAIPVRK